jgi:hypothetical protein
MYFLYRLLKTTDTKHSCLVLILYDLERVTQKKMQGEARQQQKMDSRVGLAQLVRFLVVELIHRGLNSRFDMGVTFIANYFFSGRRHPRRQ